MNSGNMAPSSGDLALVRARALCSAGRLAWFELDLPKAKSLLEESLDLFRATSDTAGTLNALGSLIMVLCWQGDDESAQARVQEGMNLLEATPNHQELLPVLSNFGWAVTFTSSPHGLEPSRQVNGEVVTLARESGDKRGLAWAQDGLGMYWYYKGDFDKAKPCLDESVSLFREVGEVWAVAHTAFGIGNIAIEEGDYTKAWQVLDEAMDIQIQLKNWVGVPYALEQFGYLAISLEQSERAARLLGAAQELRETSGSQQPPLVRALYDRHLAKLKSQVSTSELEVAWKQGRALSFEAMLSLAREQSAAPNESSTH